MISKYIPENNSELYTKQEIRNICSIKYNLDKNSILYYKSVPYVISNNINKNTALEILEKNREFSGIRIQSSLARSYVSKDLLSHIIGYMGRIDEDDYKKSKFTKFDHPLLAARVMRNHLEGISPMENEIIASSALIEALREIPYVEYIEEL